MSSKEKRISSISMCTTSESQFPDEFRDEEAAAQFSGDVHDVQMFLARLSQESGCWGRFFPVPFERAAGRSWWDPTFDSEILEEQFLKSSMAHNRHKVRYGLFYIFLATLAWFIYFITTGLIKSSVEQWPTISALLAVIAIIVFLLLLLTFTRFFYDRVPTISLCVILAFCVARVFLVIPMYPDGTATVPLVPAYVSFSSISAETLMLIYTLFPMRFYVCIIISISYSALFEIITWVSSYKAYDESVITIRLLVHFCIHLIGMHILIMNNVRMRNAFMKVGQSLLARRQLECEKVLKENMLLSLMPPSVATWLMSDERKNSMEPRESVDITKSLFRPFNMNRLENVSILFADIVGFTRMASTKTAEELVVILNTLFRKFDLLCRSHNCEKIATLGDCYYCVSGCPEPVSAHAKCCVEMGLNMIVSIREFDEENSEGINMRVGVHTGTILCGIVGTRRFKFDVWSNDVTLANRMESTGKPDTVHISETTRQFLGDEYLLENGPQVSGLNTYFILGRSCDRIHRKISGFKLIEQTQNSLQLVVSPPTSPPSMSPQTRPRVLSCDTSTLKPMNNPNRLSPDVCPMKASSLPSILDSETEQDFENDEKTQIKTPTSTASSGKYSKKKKLKIPNFLKKSETTEPNGLDECQQVPMISTDKKKLDTSWTNVSSSDEPTDLLFDDQKETIDVKSYISQSRSDIGNYDYYPNDYPQFVRAGSYRSQCGRQNEFTYLSRAGSNRSKRERSPVLEAIPHERAKSITVPNFDKQKTCLEVPSHRLSTIFHDDQLSVAHSLNSRKDSGIRSNSRKSSIQQAMSNDKKPSARNFGKIDEFESPPFLCPSNNQHRVSGYFTSSQSTINSPQYNPTKPPAPSNKVHQMRKQSDRQLIKCVQENFKSKNSYFMRPPISTCSLFFLDKKIEREYRAHVHSIKDQARSIPTLATSKFNTYFDIVVSLVVFLMVSVGLFVSCRFTLIWGVAFGVFGALQIVAIVLCFDQAIEFSDRMFGKSKVKDDSIFRWFLWNAFGGILVSLPAVSVLLNHHNSNNDYLFDYLFYVGIIHFCNFTQLNCWMRNISAVIFSTVFLIFTDPFNPPLFLNLFLLLILVLTLNREFEKAYRSNFHAHYEANRDRAHMSKLKQQADFLIYNILPEHVANQLKKDAKYFENFKNVGIIFASVVNFNEMYDESYMGGREFLRVLNELISDFDELLNNPDFRHVEKIKTIGSTFMAASGLDSNLRENQDDPYEHLYSLMEFALAMQDVVVKFNHNLLEFNLVLRVGYNFGDVTAAVIGETKLYYDIWGDAVNIASRMDSTGVNGRIQVGERCLNVLEKRYTFEKRGSVYVKGKDDMNVYLLLGKKEF